MKKIFFHLILMNLAVFSLYSQKNTSWIVPNPDYAEYLELKRDGLWPSQSTDGHPLGYRPAPFTIRHNPTPAILPGYKSGEETLPTRYDLRDSSQVTSAKDQGGGETGGNCTSFATMGALESRWAILKRSPNFGWHATLTSARSGCSRAGSEPEDYFSP